MERKPSKRQEWLIEELKKTRTEARRLHQRRRDIERMLGRIEKRDGPGEGPFPYSSGRMFLRHIIALMERDEEYRYITSSPRFDGENFIVTTANVNEYQSRFFGPLPHEDMRQMFMDFVRHLREEGVDFVHYRTTMRYNYEQGEEPSNGYRLIIPTDYLKGGDLNK